MIGRGWLAAVVLVHTVLSAQAQRTAGAKPPAATQVEPAKAMESLVDRVEREITHAAQVMPADKYDFTPASLHIPGAAFAGVRSFGGEIKHIAWANYATAANISGTDPAVDQKTIDALRSKDEILAALAASYRAVHTAIGTITPANQNDAVEDVGVGASQSRESLAGWVAAHGYDHYGQLVEYLRMNGITP